MNSKTEKTVYKIRNIKTGNIEGSYSRAYHNVYEFESAEEARNANCHEAFEDEKKYNVEKYKVTYELISTDCSTEYSYSYMIKRMCKTCKNYCGGCNHKDNVGYEKLNDYRGVLYQKKDIYLLNKNLSCENYIQIKE